MVSTQCHCKDCFGKYKITKASTEARPRSSSMSLHQDNIRSHFKSTPTGNASGQVIVPWTEEWFQDLVKFRKEAYWDCHAETTKI